MRAPLPLLLPFQLHILLLSGSKLVFFSFLFLHDLGQNVGHGGEEHEDAAKLGREIKMSCRKKGQGHNKDRERKVVKQRARGGMGNHRLLLNKALKRRGRGIACLQKSVTFLGGITRREGVMYLLPISGKYHALVEEDEADKGNFFWLVEGHAFENPLEKGGGASRAGGRDTQGNGMGKSRVGKGTPWKREGRTSRVVRRPPLAIGETPKAIVGRGNPSPTPHPPTQEMSEG